MIKSLTFGKKNTSFYTRLEIFAKGGPFALFYLPGSVSLRFFIHFYIFFPFTQVFVFFSSLSEDSTFYLPEFSHSIKIK